MSHLTGGRVWVGGSLYSLMDRFSRFLGPCLICATFDGGKKIQISPYFSVPPIPFLKLSETGMCGVFGQ